MKNLAILVLEDGSIFHGDSVGANGYACGEVIFNTAMTGYQEIITDPSYSQQIITFTYPQIGNVGINKVDAQSKNIWAAGIVIRQISYFTSNWRSEYSLVEYLKSHGIVAIANIDTRHLTQKIREQGSLRGCIMTGNYNEHIALSLALAFDGINGKDLTSLVSTNNKYEYIPNCTTQTQKHYQIIVYDFGIKLSILKSLDNFGCKLTIVPANLSVAEVLSLKPNGIVLSNGPGDPMACHNAIKTVQHLIKLNIPLFGICLGHQLLALSLGAKIIKMKYGHHGANHPVQDLCTKKIIITSQNHGFVVDEESLPSTLQPTHKSLFDGSLQGIKHLSKPFYGFQGHPEASPGPQDALSLFKPFLSAVKVYYQQIQNADNIHA